jgi:hypothetical protein
MNEPAILTLIGELYETARSATIRAEQAEARIAELEELTRSSTS